MAWLNVTSDDGELYGRINLSDYDLTKTAHAVVIAQEIRDTLPYGERVAMSGGGSA